MNTTIYESQDILDTIMGITEEKSSKQKAVADFVKKELVKLGVDSPAELSKEKRKDLFDKVDKEFTSDGEADGTDLEPDDKENKKNESTHKKKVDEDLNEAKLFRVDGEVITKAERDKRAIGKDIFTDGRNWHFDLVLKQETRQEPGIVFEITMAEYNKSKLKDLTTPRTMDNYNANLFQAMFKDIQFNKRVELNGKIKDSKPKSWADKIKILEKNGIKKVRKKPDYLFLSDKELKLNISESLDEGFLNSPQMKKLMKSHPDLAKALKTTGNQTPDNLRKMVTALETLGGFFNDRGETERLKAAKFLLKNQKKLSMALNEESLDEQEELSDKFWSVDVVNGAMGTMATFLVQANSKRMAGFRALMQAKDSTDLFLPDEGGKQLVIDGIEEISQEDFDGEEIDEVELEESLNEAVDKILQQIADIVKDVNFIDASKALVKNGLFKSKDISFSTSPIPLFSIKHKNKLIIITNKKNVNVGKDDIVVGEMAIGFM